MIAYWILPLMLISSNFGLLNGDLTQNDGRNAFAWETTGNCRLLIDSGRNNLPAMEIVCTDGSRSFANQNINFNPVRRGNLVVSCWVYLDEISYGSECSLWLDVLQEDADPLWGVRGYADPNKKGWQKLTSVVMSTHPITDIRIHLMQSGNGRARFSDIRIEERPYNITCFKAAQGKNQQVEIFAAIDDYADWKISAIQDGSTVSTASGKGTIISEKLNLKSESKAKVVLETNLNGKSAKKQLFVDIKTKRNPYVWVEDSMTRVFQNTIIPKKYQSEVSLDTARNEYESFQICIRTVYESLKNIKIKISELQGDEFILPASSINWKRVGFVYVENAWPHPYLERGSKTWWPDPLLPASEFGIETESTQPIWFTVKIPDSAIPGIYSGTISISADNMDNIKIPVRIKIHKTRIPVEGYLKTAFACMDAYLEKVYGKITPSLRRSYTDFLLAHRLNPDDISRTAPPDINELRYANTKGLNAFNILNVVPERDKSEVPLHSYPSSWVCYAPVGAYTANFKRQFMDRLNAIVPELEKYGLIDKAYIYGFDERGPEYIPIIKDLFGEIKKRYPKIHTMSTCWPPAGTDPQLLNIDWYVPLSSSYNPEIAKKARENGGEMWWYVCLGPKYPYANWMLENPLIESRVIWWQVFDNDVEGMLYWLVNFWELKNNDNPIKNNDGPNINWSVTSGKELNGDGVLIYPGEKEPIGSIRLANIRDGLEDTELLKSFKERYGKSRSNATINKITKSRSEYTRDSRQLIKTKQLLLEKLDFD